MLKGKGLTIAAGQGKYIACKLLRYKPVRVHALLLFRFGRPIALEYAGSLLIYSELDRELRAGD